MRYGFNSYTWFGTALLTLISLLMAGIVPTAAKQTVRLPTALTARNNTTYLPFITTEPNSLDTFLPEGALTLSGVSRTGLNPTDAALTFNLVGASFWQQNVSATSFTVNDEVVPAENITISTDSIRVDNVLTDGKNVIHMMTVDAVGRPLYFDSTVWAGTNILHVNFVNTDGTSFTEQLTVTLTLMDEQVVYEEISTNTGVVDFKNVPSSTIFIKAVASGNRTGAIGVVGGAENVTVTLLGFDSPSNVDNNDFSQGTNGWTVGSAPVQIVPHDENVGPVPSAILGQRLTPPLAPVSERWQRHSTITQRVAAVSHRTTNSLAFPNALVDNDLQLETFGEGPQFVSRTFQTTPEVSAVRLRYRFVTSEVPGGYFGSKFNDYFSVSIRSQRGGGAVWEANSMNGMGLDAFDAGGSTVWRDIILPVDFNGDVIKIDISVANVADGLLDSQVSVDFIEEIGVRVIPTLTWNNTQGGLDLRYTVIGGEVPEARDITVAFANGPGYNNRLGAPLFTYRVPQGTAAGQYGPVHIPGNTLKNDPNGTTHLVAASNPNSVGALADVQIAFGPNANATVVSPAMLNVVKDGLRVAGQAHATITSTARTPAD